MTRIATVYLFPLVVSNTRVRTLLTEQDAAMLRDTNQSFPEDTSPSSYVAFGLELEDQQ